MDSSEDTLFNPNTTPHPGNMVLEYLDFNGWSQKDLARRTGISAKTISEICNQKSPITPVTALAFERAFQRPAHLWLNLQRQFDEAEARRRDAAKGLDWHVWAKLFPLKEMRELDFSLPVGRSDTDALLNFFGVASPSSWDSVWKAAAVAYRQTRTPNMREQAIAAWVRETEIVAQGLQLREFSADLLFGSVEELRKLTRIRTSEIMDPVQRICANAGVAVVWVPALKNSGISGCARWLTDRKALIGLTLRYKSDDQLWFTFFHELGHILLHRNKRPFVLDNAEEDLSDRVVDPEMEQFEEEANRFAADTLIPPVALGIFLKRGTFTNAAIHSFAETVGIGPGIVVGRLQFDGILARHQGNSLKQKLDWEFVEER